MEIEVQQRLVHNIYKIMRDRKLTQVAVAGYMGTNPSQLSKILKGMSKLQLEHVANLAISLSMREIDIFTYPEKYVRACDSQEPFEAILQLKLQKETKDQVLKLIFGDSNIEIFNK